MHRVGGGFVGDEEAGADARGGGSGLAPMTPMPPAFETAAASRAVPTKAMPAETTGVSIL